MTDKVLETADSGLDASIGRLFDLLRIPSVSTDPAYKEHCAAAAAWCAQTLREIGFDADVRPSAGHPMVVGHAGPEGATPHLLFYGHYDVQPPDPLDLWDTPPFEPQRTTDDQGREVFRARGACDDKGQFMTFVEAVRAIRDTGHELPARITVLLEGEEECGSPSLEPFLEANAGELKADVALVCDTGMWNEKTPAITSMLRGLMLEEFIVKAASHDLHSGMFGGAVRNPVHVVARIVADLHDADGRVTVPGFYDGVEEVPDEVRAQWASLEFDEDEFLAKLGLPSASGETGYSIMERVWARPTCDINGIVGGYTGKGSKTVIAAQASAKCSFRLVGKQDPGKIAESFRSFVRARVPEDCTVEFIRHGGDPAITFDLSGPYFDAARKGLSDEFGSETALIGCGGSIPIVGSFKRRLGMDSLLVGFGLDDDRIHSPNEQYTLSSFHHGIRSWVRILDELGQLGRA